jgi:hypothetical protein
MPVKAKIDPPPRGMPTWWSISSIAALSAANLFLIMIISYFICVRIAARLIRY